MSAKRRTPEELERGLEGWTEGCFEEYIAARDRLAAIVGGLEQWAVEVGHNALEQVVPEWARPKLSAPAPTVYDREKEEKMTGLLFELEQRARPAKRSSARARKERKSQRDAWAASKGHAWPT